MITELGRVWFALMCPVVIVAMLIFFHRLVLDKLKFIRSNPTKQPSQLDKVSEKFAALEQMREFWSGIHKRQFTDVWVNKNGVDVFKKYHDRKFCNKFIYCRGCFISEYFNTSQHSCNDVLKTIIKSKTPDNAMKKRLDAVEKWLVKKYGEQIKQRKGELDEIDRVIKGLEVDWDK